MKVHILILFYLILFNACSEKPVFEYIAKENLFSNVPAKFTAPLSLSDAQNLSVKISGHLESYPVQLDSSNLAYFLPKEEIWEKTKIQVITTPSGIKNPIQISQNDAYIMGTYQDRLLFKYAIKTAYPPDTIPQFYQRSGFIHPLNSYQGHTLTMDFPQGHLHQHGLFKAWVNTTFRGKKVDFWNQKDLLGTVRHKEVLQVSNGPVFSGFSTSLEHLAFIDSDTVVVLEEVWELRFYPLASSYWIEWTCTEQCGTNDSLQLNTYHYGGAAFRATDLWNVEKGAYDSLVYVLTSEGKTHIAANHSRPDWVAMFGNFNNDQAGIAMMGHPQNFRYPQPIRVHPTMPYFCFAPMVTGPFSIKSGESYISKYGLLVYDSHPPEKFIDKMRTFFHSD